MTAFELYDNRQHDVASIARILGGSRTSVYRAIGNRDASNVSPMSLRLVTIRMATLRPGLRRADGSSSRIVTHGTGEVNAGHWMWIGGIVPR